MSAIDISSIYVIIFIHLLTLHVCGIPVPIQYTEISEDLKSPGETNTYLCEKLKRNCFIPLIKIL